MKRSLPSRSPKALLALLALLPLHGCSDEVSDMFPCAGVSCDTNAFCLPTTGACQCNDGFELHEGVCAQARCSHDQECDDGLTCNGAETCNLETGQCQTSTPVTCEQNERCEEPSGTCACLPLHADLGEGCEPVDCFHDSDCDDGLICNGTETCDQDLGVCASGTPVLCGRYERCEESTDGNLCVASPPADSTACMLIGTTDWGSVGSLAVMNLETGEIRDDITTFAQDSAIRIVDQDVYILERHLYDAVLKLDQRNHYQTLWNFSVATDAAPVPNPHDIVRWGDHLFLALYNEGRILRAALRPNPSVPSSFLGAAPFSRRITPPAWDGAFSELTALRVDGDLLFALTQGLDDGWACGSAENKGRIYAFHLPDLTDAPVFEGGKNYVELAHCNPGGWVPMPDGRLLVHSLAGYRSIHGPVDDGGLQIFDLSQRKLGPVVASEATAHNRDIFSVVRVGLRYFAILAGSDFDDLGVHEVYPTQDDSTWSFDSQSFYSGYAWSIFGFGETLYIAERSWSSEALYPYDIGTKSADGPAIETTYAPESMTLFYREGGCW